MKSEKASQILLLTAGLVLFFGGIFRGEARCSTQQSNKIMYGVCRNWIRK